MSLSKTQTNRLGQLLAVMFDSSVPSALVRDLFESNMIEQSDGKIKLTDKGLDEKNRLCTLAGLNIKYQSERDLRKTQ
jgi:hypothetical protein